MIIEIAFDLTQIQYELLLAETIKKGIFFYVEPGERFKTLEEVEMVREGK